MKNTKDAISYLCNKEKKVSSHYLISQNGTCIYNLVEINLEHGMLVNHFGKTITDINSISIGIELDYSPNGKNNKFSIKMIIFTKKTY